VLLARSGKLGPMPAVCGTASDGYSELAAGDLALNAAFLAALATTGTG
jgi:hypothetical protein